MGATGGAGCWAYGGATIPPTFILPALPPSHPWDFLDLGSSIRHGTPAMMAMITPAMISAFPCRLDRNNRRLQALIATPAMANPSERFRPSWVLRMPMIESGRPTGGNRNARMKPATVNGS